MCLFVYEGRRQLVWFTMAYKSQNRQGQRDRDTNREREKRDNRREDKKDRGREREKRMQRTTKRVLRLKQVVAVAMPLSYSSFITTHFGLYKRRVKNETSEVWVNGLDRKQLYNRLRKEREDPFDNLWLLKNRDIPYGMASLLLILVSTAVLSLNKHGSLFKIMLNID